MADKTSALTKSSNMKNNAIDPNDTGNLSLVNWYKTRRRQISGALHFILKNHVSRKRYNSFQPYISKFIYTYDRSEQQITCGLNLFMMALQVIKTQMVINNQSKERKIENMTTESCENNVCTYLTKMQEMWNEIDSLRKDGINYNKQRFLILTFGKLGKISGDFLADVKQQHSERVKKPSAFNTSTVIVDIINLYTKYKDMGD